MKTNNNIPSYRFQGYTDAWELRKLGELAEIVRGASPRPIQDPKWFDEQSEIGWLRISDVTEQDGRIYHLEQKISKLGQQKTRVLVEPHLLLSIAATVGKPVVNYVKTGVHDGFLIFLEPRFEQEFMFQWLEMFRSSWSKYGQPGSQVNLNSDLVKNQELSIPTHPEQEAIGTFFSTLDRQITLHQRKLDTLKEQKKTYLKLLFPAKGQTKPALRFQGFEDDWEEVKLGEVAKMYQPQTITGGDLIEEGIPVFGANGYIGYYSDCNHVTDQVTISARGEGTGTPNFVKAPVWITGNSMVINVDENKDLDKKFLYSNFLAYDFKKYVSGGAQPQLTRDVLSLVKISLPSLPEQEVIGTFFQTLDQEIAQVEDKLASLKEMKKTLLRKLFV
ncbi:TPA: restriction endonuclease subunit S [Streptococcus suis]|nr:restriction endonuclease subunit S [Streptococcus suis]